MKSIKAIKMLYLAVMYTVTLFALMAIGDESFALAGNKPHTFILDMRSDLSIWMFFLFILIIGVIVSVYFTVRWEEVFITRKKVWMIYNEYDRVWITKYVFKSKRLAMDYAYIQMNEMVPATDNDLQKNMVELGEFAKPVQVEYITSLKQMVGLKTNVYTHIHE